jgi:hypothetical protein
MMRTFGSGIFLYALERERIFQVAMAFIGSQYTSSDRRPALDAYNAILHAEIIDSIVALDSYLTKYQRMNIINRVVDKNSALR